MQNPEHIHKIEEYSQFKPKKDYRLWLYKIEDDVVFHLNRPCEYFNSDWLQILEDGTAIVRKDYAWDGCSLKFSFFDMFVFGTPDGIIDIKTQKSKTYFASLLHDAMYQYLEWHCLSRKEVDEIFYKALKLTGFRSRHLYYAGVRLFGGFMAKKKVKNPNYIFIKSTTND